MLNEVATSPCSPNSYPIYQDKLFAIQIAQTRVSQRSVTFRAFKLSVPCHMTHSPTLPPLLWCGRRYFNTLIARDAVALALVTPRVNF